MFSDTNPSNGEPFFPLSVVEYRATHDPDTVWAKIPTSVDSYDAGFIDITYFEFQNAVDGATEWLRSISRAPGDTIAYFGPWDPRYVWMVLGACKAGYKMVLPTLLFTAPVLDRLVMTELGCKTVITALESVPGLVTDFVSRNDLQHVECPPLEWFLHQKHEQIPCKTYKDAADDVLAIMYTSGSTSDAKPIIWTNSFAASFLRQNVMEPPTGWESMDRTQQGVRLINILPVLHCGSLYSHMFTAPLTKSLVHYPLSGSSLHPETFLKLLENVEVDTAIMSPAFAEYIAADPARLAKVASKLSVLAYAGGPLSTFAGEVLSKAIKLFSLFACTENGAYPTIRPAGPWDRERWRTVRFHPDAGVKLEKVGDGSYEIVIVRPTNSSLHDAAIAPALKSFPHINEWRTEDVFTPDPFEDGSWVYSRRISDTIIYEDGSTFNPLPYEQHLRSHSAVAGALLFGSKKPEAVMLLEPAAPYNNTQQDPNALLDLIWPCVEEANRLADGHCNVSRARIVITTPGREIPRATKGTIQRGKARIMYHSELVAKLGS